MNFDSKLCRLPDSGDSMDLCSNCKEWYHYTCITGSTLQNTTVLKHDLTTYSPSKACADVSIFGLHVGRARNKASYPVLV